MNEMDKGCRNYSPQIDTRSVFEKAGFQKAQWVKNDPRGAEYGFFTAHVMDGTVSNGWIEVHHSKDDYSMIFNREQDFLNWSKSV